MHSCLHWRGHAVRFLIVCLALDKPCPAGVQARHCAGAACPAHCPTHAVNPMHRLESAGTSRWHMVGVCWPRCRALPHAHAAAVHPPPAPHLPGTYAFHTRTGVFELALPDTLSAAHDEAGDEKRQLKRQYRVCLSRPRLCVNNFGVVPDAAEAQELLSHAKRRSNNRRRGQHGGEDGALARSKRGRKAGGAAGAGAASAADLAAALGASGGFPAGTFVPAMVQGSVDGAWDAMQEAMRAAAMAAPGMWPGFPLAAAQAGGGGAWTTTAGMPATWPAAALAAAPAMQYFQTMAGMPATSGAMSWPGMAEAQAAAAAATAGAATDMPSSRAASSAATGGRKRRRKGADKAPDGSEDAGAAETEQGSEHGEWSGDGDAASKRPRAEDEAGEAAAAVQPMAMAAGMHPAQWAVHPGALNQATYFALAAMQAAAASGEAGTAEGGWPILPMASLYSGMPQDPATAAAQAAAAAAVAAQASDAAGRGQSGDDK